MNPLSYFDGCARPFLPGERRLLFFEAPQREPPEAQTPREPLTPEKQQLMDAINDGIRQNRNINRYVNNFLSRGEVDREKFKKGLSTIIKNLDELRATNQYQLADTEVSDEEQQLLNTLDQCGSKEFLEQVAKDLGFTNVVVSDPDTPQRDEPHRQEKKEIREEMPSRAIETAEKTLVALYEEYTVEARDLRGVLRGWKNVNVEAIAAGCGGRINALLEQCKGKPQSREALKQYLDGRTICLRCDTSGYRPTMQLRWNPSKDAFSVVNGSQPNLQYNDLARDNFERRRMESGVDKAFDECCKKTPRERTYDVSLLVQNAFIQIESGGLDQLEDNIKPIMQMLKRCNEQIGQPARTSQDQRDRAIAVGIRDQIVSMVKEKLFLTREGYAPPPGDREGRWHAYVINVSTAQPSYGATELNGPALENAKKKHGHELRARQGVYHWADRVA
ncbi:TPA: hypothetical protein DCL30_05245 [Candidatus Peribacteria bacterium]|nr:MAG: hypothetical protein A3J91_05095 [Candidatus Peribacteria bacterium RIFOXYC2_FULL_58_10]OGJ84704.1 MAG: hypothetical protein A2529_00930 [Candidatus Peribacteria bacterium RIFOXYD2_FULL_58_15]HAI98902.1 hypothetical protein [Candidatus Peribacteria bacterium]HAS33701.1 hypothetical protein [Candidatus Peribacteria bacterium]